MVRELKTANSERGLTLIELLISLVIISLVTVVCTQLVGGALDSWNHDRGKSDLLNEARITMERIVARIRNTTWVILPLKISDPTDPGYPGSSYYPSGILAVSGNIDNDGDGLADEDPGNDMNGDNAAGIMMIDDDNDGLVDEEIAHNDDEDWNPNEDDIDGIDNDGDGLVDEDTGGQFYPFSPPDDDNDGTQSEDPFDPVIYYRNGTTLMERQNVLTATVSDSVIAENVSAFTVLRRRVNGNTLIDIYLKLDNGKDSVELNTTALAWEMFKP